MTTVYLKPGRVKPLLYRHPWVFADSIARIDGEVGPGAVVDVRAPDGRFLARGFWSGSSALRVRGFAFEEGVEPDRAWVRERIAAAVRLRHDLLGLGGAAGAGGAGAAGGTDAAAPQATDGPGTDTNAYRLVHGDADGLPGLVVDRMGDFLALQVTSSGLEARREDVLDALEEALSPRGIVELPDLGTRKKEGLPAPASLQRGEAPPENGVVVREHGLRYRTDLVHGQKTGFFCDQRPNRALVGQLARGRRVLDAFCYAGAFALNAARGGADVVEAIDSSPAAIEAARANADDNGLAVGFHKGDVYKLLGEWRHASKRFDVVVLDPPSYARSRRDLNKALKKYAELFALGVEVTTPGGVLVCCSCSGLVDDETFEAVLREVCRRTQRELRIFHRGGQGPDHPVSVTCPEGRYLKAYFCHVP